MVAPRTHVDARKRTGGARKIVQLSVHPEPYVTTSDLAEYWRVSRKQIYKQIEAGTLTAIRLGPRLLRISTAEAIRFEQAAKMSPPCHEHDIGLRQRGDGAPPTSRDSLSQAPSTKRRRPRR
jgi:excisionase family DNA binding protein